MNDSTYPWLILVPQRPDIREIFELVADDQQQLLAEPDSGIEHSRVLQAEQRFRYSRPIVAGDELTATLRVTSIKTLGGNSMVTSESSMVDARGEHVVTSVSTLVIRGEEA